VGERAIHLWHFRAVSAAARTREQLEWIADEITEAGGEASIWLAQPASVAQERDLASRMAAARAGEYTAVSTEARAAATARAREARRTRERLRAELCRIGRRDYFPPPERDAAHEAVGALLDRAGSDDSSDDAKETSS
jgi:hypothetical protein